MIISFEASLNLLVELKVLPRDGPILGLPNEMCNNFKGVPKIRCRHGISSLGEPKFLTIYDEIHNKSFLMQRIYNLRQFYPDDHHSPNISFNIMMFYSSAFQNPV